ncbi:MAG TPA: SIMPL domain-containing protein [Candidatus Paceibacterota bacterium]|jgi:hypothetical protein|nr:SIMPL domain-containing protein [Candidatus Paceibacterota bacterium]
MADKFFDRPSVAAAFVVGAFLLVTGAIFSWAFYSARQGDDTIVVTGSAKTDVKADSAKWTIEVYRSAEQGGLQQAYVSVAKDADAVKRYFKAQGIADDAVTANTASADEQYNNNGPTTYRVHQEITVSSADVSKVQALSQNAGALLNQGLSVSPRQPEYYISNLPELRVSLLGQAIADAKARAQEIAKSGGSSVGKLSGASSGVVQVMAPNSTSVEDYGSYDTSTIDKEVSVTARATFVVR